MQRLQTLMPASSGETAIAITASARSTMREAAGIAGFFGVKEVRGKSVVANHGAHFVLAEAARVARTVPVEIRDHRGLRSKLRVPEALEEIPVDEALYVVVSSLDPELGDIRRFEFDLECAQAPPELGKLLRHGPQRACVQLAALAAKIVVEQFARQRLPGVEIARDLTAGGAGDARQLGEGALGAFGVHDHLIAVGEVDAAVPEPRGRDIALYEEEIVQMAAVAGGLAGRFGEVHADDECVWRESCEPRRLVAEAATGVEDDAAARQVSTQYILRLETVERQIPGALILVQPLLFTAALVSQPFRRERVIGLLLPGVLRNATVRCEVALERER